MIVFGNDSSSSIPGVLLQAAAAIGSGQERGTLGDF